MQTASRVSRAEAERPSGQVDATLRAMRSAVPAARITVSARQDRNHGELLPTWMLHISGPLSGSEFSIELAGPLLGQMLEDAIEALVTLGIDVSDAESPYTPITGADVDSFPG